jgi:hypothetical protein
MLVLIASDAPIVRNAKRCQVWMRVRWGAPELLVPVHGNGPFTQSETLFLFLSLWNITKTTDAKVEQRQPLSIRSTPRIPEYVPRSAHCATGLLASNHLERSVLVVRAQE